jgi:hypothetical protein
MIPKECKHLYKEVAVMQRDRLQDDLLPDGSSSKEAM